MRRWLRRCLESWRSGDRPGAPANPSIHPDPEHSNPQTLSIPLNDLDDPDHLTSTAFTQTSPRTSRAGIAPPLTTATSRAESVGTETEVSAVFTTQTTVTDITAVSNSWSLPPEPLDLGEGGRHYKAGKGTYIGRPELVQPPAKAKEHFDNIKSRVLEDLEGFNRIQPSRKRRTPYIWEDSHKVFLGMSGQVVEGMITLLPTIFIRSHDHKAMRRAIKDGLLAWVQNEEPKLAPHLVLRHPRPLALTTPAPDTADLRSIETGPGLRGSIALGFHIGFLPRHVDANSLHGACCRVKLFRDGAMIGESYSRLGGLVEIDGNLCAVTTAHQIFDGLTRGEDPELESLSSLDDDCESSDKILDSSFADVHQITFWSHYAGNFRTVLNFAGYRLQASCWNQGLSLTRSSAEGASDFAIFPIGPSVAPSEWFSPCEILASSVAHQTVEILLGDHSVSATVCPDGGTLSVCGKIMPTTLLSLRAPLPRGSSGAWVFRGRELCGMVVAGYQDEPYVHMIEAAQLLDDVKRSFPAGTPIRFLTYDSLKFRDEEGKEECPPSAVGGANQRSHVPWLGRLRTIKSYVSKRIMVPKLLDRMRPSRIKSPIVEEGDKTTAPSSTTSSSEHFQEGPGYTMASELAATGLHLEPIPEMRSVELQQAPTDRALLLYHYNDVPFESFIPRAPPNWMDIDQMTNELTATVAATEGTSSSSHPTTVEISDHMSSSAATSNTSLDTSSTPPEAATTSKDHGPRKRSSIGKNIRQ